MRVQVTTTRPQRWRAGLLFSSAAPVILDVDDLSEEQQKALRNDPALSVGPAPEEVDEGKKPTKSAKDPGK